MRKGRRLHAAFNLVSTAPDALTITSPHELLAGFLTMHSVFLTGVPSVAFSGAVKLHRHMMSRLIILITTWRLVPGALAAARFIAVPF